MEWSSIGLHRTVLAQSRAKETDAASEMHDLSGSFYPKYRRDGLFWVASGVVGLFKAQVVRRMHQ